MAQVIFDDMTKGWDGVCGGGTWWSTDRTYKNAIANELFLTVAARLYERTSQGSYLDWANKEWGWFDKSGMIKARNLVNDGLKWAGPVDKTDPARQISALDTFSAAMAL